MRVVGKEGALKGGGFEGKIIENYVMDGQKDCSISILFFSSLSSYKYRGGKTFSGASATDAKRSRILTKCRDC